MEDLHFGHIYKAVVDQAVSVGMLDTLEDYPKQAAAKKYFARATFFTTCKRKDIGTQHIRAAQDILGIAPDAFFKNYFHLTRVNTNRQQLIEEHKFQIDDAMELSSLRKERDMLKEQNRQLQAHINDLQAVLRKP